MQQSNTFIRYFVILIYNFNDYNNSKQTYTVLCTLRQGEKGLKLFTLQNNLLTVAGTLYNPLAVDKAVIIIIISPLELNNSLIE